jgi:hypothetical protein
MALVTLRLLLHACTAVRARTPSYIPVHRSAVREGAYDRVLSRLGTSLSEAVQPTVPAPTNLGVRGSNPFGRATSPNVSEPSPTDFRVLPQRLMGCREGAAEAIGPPRLHRGYIFSRFSALPLACFAINGPGPTLLDRCSLREASVPLPEVVRRRATSIVRCAPNPCAGSQPCCHSVPSFLHSTRRHGQLW